MRPYFGAKIHFRLTFCINHFNFLNFNSLFVLAMASNNPEVEEVSRVNKLLQIEDLAWSRQLEKAVRSLVRLFLDLDLSILALSFELAALLIKYWLCSQGFRDTSLTVWDASTILHNYEVRTGNWFPEKNSILVSWLTS